MIGICLGIALAAFLTELPVVWFTAILVLIAIFIYLRGQTSKLKFGGVLLIGFCYGVAWGQWNLYHRLPPSSELVEIVVVGEITGIPQNDDRISRFMFDVEQVEGGSAQVVSRLRRLKLSWYNSEKELSPGQRWRLTVRLKPPVGLQNPGAADYTLHMLQRSVDAKGYVRNKDVMEVLTPAAFSIDRWRYQLLGEIQALSLSSTAKATLSALLLGEKSALSDPQWRLLRDTGTVHLIIISGLHISIICLIGYFLGGMAQKSLARVFRVVDQRWWRIIPALMLAIAYALIAGFSLPTQRAVVMIAALLLPGLLGVYLTLWQRWWLALTAVLMLQPLSVYQPGLWLSFTAVAALISLSSQSSNQTWLDRLQLLMRSQWVVFIGLLPWLLFFTGEVAPWSALINLVAIPFLTFVFLPAILLLLALWPMFSEVAGAGLEGMINFFWSGLEWFVQFTGPALVLDISLWTVVLITPGVMLLLLGMFRFRWLGLFMALPLLSASAVKGPEVGFQAWIYDVGQGLAVLIQTENHALLYDTGAGFRSGGGVAQFTVVPALAASGISYLDNLIVSHADNDHAGGFIVIRQNIELQQVEGGSRSWRKRYGAAECQHGKEWYYDDVRFRFIQPGKPFPVNENNSSCVLLVESGGCSLLIPGDIESAVETQILNRYPGLKVDWLVAAHHGSRSSTSLAWLQQLQPKEVFFSAGLLNRYGHPAAEIVSRVEAVGAGWRNTAQGGAILLREASGGCTSESLSTLKKRYWTAS